MSCAARRPESCLPRLRLRRPRSAGPGADGVAVRAGSPDTGRHGDAAVLADGKTSGRDRRDLPGPSGHCGHPHPSWSSRSASRRTVRVPSGSGGRVGRVRYTHAMFEAALGPSTTSEAAASVGLLGRPAPGMLCCLQDDRGQADHERGDRRHYPLRTCLRAGRRPSVTRAGPDSCSTSVHVRFHARC